jgi:bifunctional DNA-binding transcriptional regulator/antitoxin component of YhaV-PrlF toxin-antitoxin module
MELVIVEVASVSSSGVMALPKRIREAIGLKGSGRVVFFANRETRCVVVVHEARCRVPPGTPRRPRFGQPERP